MKKSTKKKYSNSHSTALYTNYYTTYTYISLWIESRCVKTCYSSHLCAFSIRCSVFLYNINRMFHKIKLTTYPREKKGHGVVFFLRSWWGAVMNERGTSSRWRSWRDLLFTSRPFVTLVGCSQFLLNFDCFRPFLVISGIPYHIPGQKCDYGRLCK